MQKPICIVLCLTILFCSSCKEKSANQQEIALAGSDFTPIQAHIDPSKFIYHQRLKPELLTELQIEKISKHVTFRGMAVSDVWFARVLYNDQKLLTVDVYFRPTVHSARLMTGQHLSYHSFMDETLTSKSEPPAWLRSIHSKSELIQLLAEELPVYVYVPDIAQTGTERMAVPDSRFFPFERSGNFSDEELVQIVDFVRSGPSIKSGNANIIMYPDKADRTLPMRSIKKVNNHIEAETGTQEGPLSGSGQVLEIKKTGDGYELVSISLWLS